MKILLTLIFLNMWIMTSCLDQVPSDRPTFSNRDIITDTETGDDIEVLLDVPNRPSGAIIMQTNHCACQNGESISLGNCASICAGKPNNANEILHFNVNLTTAITLDIYQDVNGWCNTVITDPNTNEPKAGETNPFCQVEFVDENGVRDFLDFSASSGSTALSVDVGGLDFNKTYRLTLVEGSSGARSTTIQLRKVNSTDGNEIEGPLGLMPVNQFTCMINTVERGNNGEVTNIVDSNRTHFYFVAETRPEPLTENAEAYCHDRQTHGSEPINSPLLEEEAGNFSVWNRNDPRFFDLDSDGQLQIHNIIEEEVERQGQNLSNTPEFFFELIWPNGITTQGSDSSNDTAAPSQASLGFYMTPFIDDNTFKAFCPTQAHYFSSNPIFKAMREVVGVDTEGLYVAKKEGFCDFVLVRENLIRQIWFFKENGQHIQPNDDTISGKQIQFYWPADTSSPFIKKSHQETYTLKRAEELTCNDASVPESSGQNGSGVRSNFPPHDKRIGCVPVLKTSN